MISYDKPVLSMRTHQNYTILVGETHCNHENVDDNQHFQNLLKKIDDKPDYLWSNVDVMTNDYLPYIGYFKKLIDGNRF